MKRHLLVVAPLLTLAGCATLVAPPSDVEPRAVYQTIANALPDANLGLGSPPSIALMSASARADGPPPEPPPLKATERGFNLRFQVYRPRCVWVPYTAIREVRCGWEPLPNVLFAALIVLPLQVQRATVVFDARQVPDLLAHIEADASRLESISREIGLGGPWAHAQGVRWKLEQDASEEGPGMLTVHFDVVVGVPAWLPYGGRARTLAEAFAWAAAHPDAPILDEQPAPPAPR